jgi:CSLREA domain-containing protein
MNRRAYLFRTIFPVVLSIALWLAVPGLAQPQATILVTTTADGINQDGLCSLREAILAANTDTQVDACPAGNGVDTLILPDGVFLLSQSGAFENEGLTGDLDLYSSMNIYGYGAEFTLIDGSGLDRVIHIIGEHNVGFYNLTIQNGVAPGGSTESRGGGIYNYSGILALRGVKLINNQANNTGGGIDNFGGTLTIYDVTIASNQAQLGGGIFNQGTLFASRSLITGNTALDTGGGLDNNDQASLFNVTISGNTAAVDPDGQGGSGIFSDGPLQLVNVTLVNNSGKGGWVNESLARVSNSLLAQNEDVNCSGTRAIFSEGSNLDDDGSCLFASAGDLVSPDAGVEELANNEGPTWTHALSPDSPAIDAGNDSSCQAVDQRGAIRPADGNGDGAVVCDIGAFELNATFNTLYLPVIQG